MQIPLYQIDAFTDAVFGGNPAAVCRLESWIDDRTMQRIAEENNLSETAFFVKVGDKYEIRWFTPEMEIDLAGHPTLATAYAIYHHLNYSGQKIVFQSPSGELIITRRGDLICMDFPTREALPVQENEWITGGLGHRPLELYKSRDYLAIFEKEEDILALQPDWQALRKVDCLGIIVSSPGKRSDFVSRFFAPSAGILEDPVTGSAHSTLIPYWAKRLAKNDLYALQLSRRRGELFCKFLGDRVEIAGRAVTYMVGTITI